MALADLLSLTIALTTRSPSQIGFGTPLLAAYHTRNTDRVRSYRSVAELEGDGFVSTDAVHKAVSALFAQNPSVQLVKIGRRALAPAQSLKLVPSITTEGTVYVFLVDGVEVTYTVPAGASVASICAALVTLINADGAATPGLVDSAVGPFDLRGVSSLTTLLQFAFETGGNQSFSATAVGAVVTGTGGAFASMAAETMIVQVGTSPTQTVTFGTEATIALAIALMNVQLTECHAEAVDANNVKIIADRRGSGSRIRTSSVAAGITTKLGIANNADVSGSGSFADLGAVTAAEIATLCAAITNGTVTDVDGKVRAQSATTGILSTAKVNAASTADVVLGGQFATNATGTGAAASGSTVVPDVLAVDHTTYFAVNNSGAAGVLHAITDVSAGLVLTDVTANPGIATDLSAIEAADGDWYALLLDSNSEAEIEAAAAWAEARIKLLVAATSDGGVLDSGVTTDVASDLQAAGYVRTAPIWHHDQSEYIAAAWVGLMLSKKPGSATWANKQLSGITFKDPILTTSQLSALVAKSCNRYERIKGLGFTFSGITSGGEYIDVTIGVDQLRDWLETAWVKTLAEADKVPFTDAGGDVVRGVVTGALTRAVRASILAADPAPTVFVPLVADVPTEDRAARHMPDVEFSAQLAGAIHKLTVSGTLSS